MELNKKPGGVDLPHSNAVFHAQRLNPIFWRCLCPSLEPLDGGPFREECWSSFASVRLEIGLKKANVKSISTFHHDLPSTFAVIRPTGTSVDKRWRG